MNVLPRVVVTGYGCRTPIGFTASEIVDHLVNLKGGVRAMPEWQELVHLRSMVAAPCGEIGELTIDRGHRRSMGRVAMLAALASRDALEHAGIAPERCQQTDFGISFGSTEGSQAATEEFFGAIRDCKGMTGIQSSTYLKTMSHTCAANLGSMFHVKGPVIASCTACVAGSQGIGIAYDMIRLGRANVMIAGGAEELHYVNTGVFEIMHSSSVGFNDHPDQTPRPFDVARDGLVIGEGAGCLVVEEYEHARRRGAQIHAEILGFGTNCDGDHMTRPDKDSMAMAMKLALADARLDPDAIGHINAHATATPTGDLAEATATASLFGDRTPVTAFKGYTGHTLGACGAIESIFSLLMLKENFIPATKNLDTPDPSLPPLRHVMGSAVQARLDKVMVNNFAFGGINTSLIFGRV